MVGKSDFNENPVVNPDLDLDFGLRLRVCQKYFFDMKMSFVSHFTHLSRDLSRQKE